MPAPRHARRLRRLRVPPPHPDVVLGGSRLRAPWVGPDMKSTLISTPRSRGPSCLRDPCIDDLPRYLEPAFDLLGDQYPIVERGTQTHGGSPHSMRGTCRYTRVCSVLDTGHLVV